MKSYEGTAGAALALIVVSVAVALGVALTAGGAERTPGSTNEGLPAERAKSGPTSANTPSTQRTDLPREGTGSDFATTTSASPNRSSEDSPANNGDDRNSSRSGHDDRRDHDSGEDGSDDGDSDDDRSGEDSSDDSGDDDEDSGDDD